MKILTVKDSGVVAITICPVNRVNSLVEKIDRLFNSAIKLITVVSRYQLPILNVGKEKERYE